jgi:hypothetical protein
MPKFEIELPSSAGVETFAAVDGATGAWWEGDFGVAAASRADCRVGESGAVGAGGAASARGVGTRGAAVVAKTFLPTDRGSGLVGANHLGVAFGAPEHSAIRATVRLTETAFSVKGLFCYRKRKRLPTILTDERLLHERQCHSLIVLDLH